VIKVINKHDEKGQGLIEYALILLLVALVVILTLVILGPAIGNSYSHVIDVI
jgi:pilus assembly protein Flp/PilA